MKKQTPLIFTLAAILFFAACGKTNLPPEPVKPPAGITPSTGTTPTGTTPAVTLPPTVTGFAPQTAFIGDVITITGQHLGTNPAALIVKFGTVEATVLTATETSATVTVPDDITQASAKISITAGNTTVTSATDFQLKAPVIKSISYTSGFSGQILAVKGQGFRNSYHIGQISFGTKAIPASSTTVGNTELDILVPDGVAAGKYPVTVTVAGLSATSLQVFEVFVPTITSFTPHAARAGSTMVITGTNLKNPNRDDTRVSFVDFKTGQGLRAAYVGTVTSTSIQLFVPDALRVGSTYRILVTVVGSGVKTTEAFTCTKQ